MTTFLPVFLRSSSPYDATYRFLDLRLEPEDVEPPEEAEEEDR